MATVGDPAKPAGVAVLEALGLPTEKCLGLTIEFRPNSLVEVIVRYAPEHDEIEAAAQVLRGYMVAFTPTDG